MERIIAPPHDCFIIEEEAKGKDGRGSKGGQRVRRYVHEEGEDESMEVVSGGGGGVVEGEEEVEGWTTVEVVKEE